MRPAAPLIAVALLLSSQAHAQPQSAAQTSRPEQLVDALNGVFGKHAARAVHAKGIVLEGSFTPTPEAARISKAPHFQASVPVTVRFSDFAGIPTIPDNDKMANPRGMAIKFHLPNGSASDIVAHSFNGFPSPTADDFRQLLIAIAASGPGTAKPTPLDTYLASHPTAKTFLTAPKPTPISFGTLPYYGVNTFKYTNASGGITYGRYQFLPLAGEHYVPDTKVAALSPDFLSDEIRKRVAKGPVKFKVMLQVAAPGDKLDDPSITWPKERRLVELGTISVKKTVPDNDAAQKALLFLPNALPEGIAPADPMIDARSAAYPVSFGRRQ